MFNMKIEKLADEYRAVYINIFDLYTVDGALDSEVTIEGVHLKKDTYDRWYNEIRPYIEDVEE